MIVNAVSEAVNFVKIVWKSERWILMMEVGDDFIDSRRQLEEERVIDELDITVEG